LYDLTIFPLCIDHGQERYELPGLLVAAAPRKAARMRSGDQLVIYMRLALITTAGRRGGTNLSSSQQQEMLNRLSETYFLTAGSVTAGMRAVIARLNEFLLNRNLRHAQEGHLIGSLNLAAVHGDRLIVANAGPTHSFILTKSLAKHLDDGQARGLGLSRQVVPRFYQCEIEPGDLFLLSDSPSPAWNSRSLAGSALLSFDHLHRRLRADSADYVQSAAIRFQPGKGQVTFWRPGEPGLAAAVETPSAEPAAEPAAPIELMPGSQPVSAHVPPFVDDEPPVDSTAVEETAPLWESSSFDPQFPGGQPEQEIQPAGPFGRATPAVFLGEAAAAAETPGAIPAEGLSPRPPRPDMPAQEAAPVDAGAVKGQRLQPKPAAVPPRAASSKKRILPAAWAAAGSPEDDPSIRKQAAGLKPRQEPKQQPAGPGWSEGLRRGLAAIWRAGSAARRSVNSAVSRIAAKLTPEAKEQPQFAQPLVRVSPMGMLSIAIMIPAVVVTVAMVIYFRAGSQERYQALYLQAAAYAQQASQLTDPVQQRQAWYSALEKVRAAEKFVKTEESRLLKEQALSAVDELEGFRRLVYQPAVAGGFSKDVNITRMAAATNDVYLLDSGMDGKQGRILRIIRTSSGYEVDTKFSCGPGKAGGLIVGPLIDLVLLSPNNETRATVMGIDENGTLVYCTPNSSGFEARVLPQPDAGWGNIAGISLYNGTLYVLDPASNAVYYYYGSDGLFEQKPHLYFGNSVPQMNDVIDLAVDQEFLYMLHADGRMTVCVSSGGFEFAPTRCTDPQPYGDTRVGYEPAPITFAGAQFTQMQSTQPPDPSLFTLDAANQSIYHLSLRRLNLQRQYRPMPDADFPLPEGAPTAFVIAPLNRTAFLAFGNQVYFAPIQ